MSPTPMCHDHSDEGSACTDFLSIPTLAASHQPQQRMSMPLLSLSETHGYHSVSRRNSTMGSNSEDDFLWMEVQIHNSPSVDDDTNEDEEASWGLLDTDDSKLWKVPMPVIAPEKQLSTTSSGTTTRPTRLIQQSFLDEEYQRTKLRFIESMLRSEQTRAIIQYQRRLFVHTRRNLLLRVYGDRGGPHVAPIEAQTITDNNDMIRERLLAMHRR